MTTLISAVHGFARDHDEMPAFRAGYMVITFLIAALFSLGMFGALIVVHMGLDIVKYRHHRYGIGATFVAMLRESLVDMTLLGLGMVFAVYFHTSLPLIAGVSGLLRAELTVVQGIGTVLPKMKMLQRFIETMTNINLYFSKTIRKTQELRPVELWCFFILGTIVSLLLLAPFVLGITGDHYRTILTEQLVPWRF